MKKELGEQVDAMPEEGITKIKDNCVKEAEKEKEMKGAMEYNKQAKCVMAAAFVGRPRPSAKRPTRPTKK